MGYQLKETTPIEYGDILQDRAKKTIGPWRTGRFMMLNLRPHSVNTYAISKLMYRCNTIDLRVADINAFNKTIKAFLYADMIESPGELTLHRDIEDGGLGMIHIQTRARAALMTTFLQTAIGRKFTRNHYHNCLYQYYVLEERIARPEIPPNFTGDFFPTLRKLKDSNIDIEDCSLKQVYGYLMKELLNVNDDDLTEDRLVPLKCELEYPETNWKKTWSLVRAKGLGPELTSFLLTLLWGIIPTKVRLNRCIPLVHTSPICQLCDQGTLETTPHALIACPANGDLPARLLRTLRRYQPGATQTTILTLNLEVEQLLELPFTWLIGTFLASIWKQREARRVNLVDTRAELEARCRLLRECKVKVWTNAHVITSNLVSQLFTD